MTFVTARTQCVGKNLNSGFPLPSLWQAGTEAKQAGKTFSVTWSFHRGIKQKKGSMYQDRKKLLCFSNEKY